MPKVWAHNIVAIPPHWHHFYLKEFFALPDLEWLLSHIRSGRRTDVILAKKNGNFGFLRSDLQRYPQLPSYQPLAPLRPNCAPRSPVSLFYGQYMAPEGGFCFHYKFISPE